MRVAAVVVLLLFGACAATAAAPLSPLAEAFSRGVIGYLHIDQSQKSIEKLLRREIAVTAFTNNRVAATLTDAADLEALGVASIDGARAASVQLTFDDPFREERRLLGIHVALQCDDVPALRERIAYDEAKASEAGAHFEDMDGKILWALEMQPACRLFAARYVRSS